MTSRGVADFVFCLDASASMAPCFDAVRTHLVSLIEGLGPASQVHWDIRFDFVAYSASELNGQHIFIHRSVFNEDLRTALYLTQSGRLFTTDVELLREQLGRVRVSGDEASLVALDFALDMPWRDAAGCHRAVILMTDEPFERGIFQAEQRARLSDLITKIQTLRVMLYMVTPESETFSKLAEVDRCEHVIVDSQGDGLSRVDYRELLSYVGKSVSVSSLQATPGRGQRALFGQDRWTPTDAWKARDA